METHFEDFGGSIFGSGIVGTERQPLVWPDYSPQKAYRSIVIFASKNNTGILYVDTGDPKERSTIYPGKEVELEISTINEVNILGSTDNTAYSWIAK
jgi:hypothetical protein